ncbi:hypothetical protein [Desulfotalea psychrophila]|uniref:hypothetical protein n=1 Tax=Desulfotalea psychrophila TaxID=84980 RepID=UPI0003038966|nr:hypothetical protein [Desulfotalea psychrophila]
MKLKTTMALVMLAWLSLIALSFFWNYTNAIKEQERVALFSARNFFQHIVAARLWNAQHAMCLSQKRHSQTNILMCQ